MEEQSLLITPTKKTRAEMIGQFLVTSIGFFSDSFDLFIINSVIFIMSSLYHISPSDKSFLSSVALFSAVLGQIFFGFIGDRVSRKTGFVVTISLIIIGSIGSGLSFNIEGFISLLTMLAVFRCILGFGIGGEYPLSATITSEIAQNPRLTGSVLCMQGFGALTAAVIAILFYSLFDEFRPDLVWRLSVGVGAVPAIILLIPRLLMTYPPVAKTKKTWPEWFLEMRQSIFNLKFLGTAGTWFLFDIAFYANALFSTAVIHRFHMSDTNPLDVLEFNCYVALMALPGYWVGVWLIGAKWCGPFRLQFFGFCGLTILYLLMAALLNDLSAGVFLFLYGLSFFFSNAGPNITTFVVPTLVYDSNTRATCHGLSAAAGKLGAALGAACMAPLLAAYGLQPVLYCCSAVAALGTIVTIIVRNHMQ